MVNIKIYVEGGGDSRDLKQRCRISFGKLVENAGIPKNRVQFVSCGGRDSAFDDFKTAMESRDSNSFPILLVDSEDPLENNNTPWKHLEIRSRDYGRWEKPSGATEDQAQLMVTCMETWIMADRAALKNIFGSDLQTSALLPITNLEQYDRHRVQDALGHATRNCGPNKAYKKGKRSFQILEALNPKTLEQRLPHFKRFIDTLEAHLG